MKKITGLRSKSSTLSALATQQVDLWHKDRQQWQKCQPVTAALAEPLDIVTAEVGLVATATTDGRRLLLNPAWSAGLTAVQRRHIQEHLVWHAAAGDYRPRHDKAPHRWHLACDHTINVQLLQLGAVLSPDTVLFPSATFWPRDKVYTWLAGHPRLEWEQSPDQLSWTTALSFSSTTSTTMPTTTMAALEDAWQHHTQATVERYRATPMLPDSVAKWLLGHR